MVKMNKKLLDQTLKIIENEKDEEILNSFLYGFMSSYILSGSFKKNIEIKESLSNFGFNYLDYVYKSRTIILSRVIRDIENFNTEQLIKFKNQLVDILLKEQVKNKEQSKEKNEKKIRKNENYVSKIIEKYTPRDK